MAAGDRAPTSAEAAQVVDLAEVIFEQHPTMSIAACDGGEPWAAKVFFVDDEPQPGRLDICCALLVTSRKLAMIEANPRVAFIVAGELPDRWIQGVGTAELVEDEADAAAIHKRLSEKSAAAGPFLERVPCRAIRIHIDRLKLTDVTRKPPIAELSFDRR